MKAGKQIFIVAVLALVICTFLPSCSSSKVSRVKGSKLTDIDGYWNDNDVRLACETLIKNCSDSQSIALYRSRNGRNPVAIVGTIKNESDEHIDTVLVANHFRNAVINSGVLDFVSSSNERQEVRAERDDQQINSSAATRKALRQETGADVMLLGSVRTIVQMQDKKTVRAYFVNMELHDLETNKILWSGEDASIKKIIKRQ